MLRATFSSLFAHATRLILSIAAVVLGVMSVSGAFVLTDTLGRSYRAMFATVYDRIDVEVSAKPKVDMGYVSAPEPVPASVLDRLRGIPGRLPGVPGVAEATGTIAVDGARVVGKDGKVLPTFGTPRYGMNWIEGDTFVSLRAGRGPRADDEVAINGALAKATGYGVGDTIRVLTLQPEREFRVVGVFGYSGDRDSLAGETIVSFTTPAAQRLMLGAPDMFSAIDVTAQRGVPATVLRDRISAALGSGYQVRTGAQLAALVSDQIGQAFRYFNYVLLGFAFVALFVGVFLILNTFSIIVAQRMRELALMRAMGASRAQVVASVQTEALAVGAVAAVIGVALGLGLGRALATLYATYLGGGVALAALRLPPAAWAGGLAVGIGVTMLAAGVPALRAARIPPVAAMRVSANGGRGLTRITVGGAVVAALGGLALWAGLSGHTVVGNALVTLLVGVLLALTGAALLAPVVARPVVFAIGALFAWWMPGRLGGRNSARNPRRTAITAAALMVGIALITGINVVLASVTASVQHVLDTQVKADLIITGEQTGMLAPTFDATVLDRTAKLPGVTSVVGVYSDMAQVDGKVTPVAAVTDSTAMRRMFGMAAAQGTLETLGPGEFMVDEQTARAAGLAAGRTVRVQFTKGAPRAFTLVGIYAQTPGVRGWITSGAEAANFRSPNPSQGFIQTAPGASVTTIKNEVAGMLARSPEVTVSDRSGYVKQQTRIFDTVLAMVQILLAMSIIIALLGIVNTLALSVIERTRELGLLRAIGLRRAQMMAMVGVESLVISLFGALLGVAIGVGLGAAAARGLRDQGITTIGVPWGQLVVYLVIGAIIGVIASVVPAVRAARLNVLAAIAYE